MQLSNLQQQRILVEQLRREAAIKRINVSQAIEDLKVLNSLPCRCKPKPSKEDIYSLFDDRRENGINKKCSNADLGSTSLSLFCFSVFKKVGQYRSFYFSFFSRDKYSTNLTINEIA